LALGGIASVDHDCRTLSQEGIRHGAPNASRATSDASYFSVKFSHVSPHIYVEGFY
jgi:hypothetical protein